MREKNTSGERVRQIWKKIGVFFTWFLLKVFALLVHFLPFWFIFCTFVCANFSDSKFCQCYFVSFFHLCSFKAAAAKKTFWTLWLQRKIQS